MKSAVYNKQGKEVGDVELPEAVFAAKWNPDLVHQVVSSIQSNARHNKAHTKDRSEVRGGGKKPWRQKGTGRARHGSRRSPIWVGGGTTHGPRSERDYGRAINKKMKVRALSCVLSAKLRDGEILFVDSIDFNEPKTAEAAAILKNLSAVEGFGQLASKKKNAAYIALADSKNTAKKSFRNIGKVHIDELRNLNSEEALSYKYLVIENPEKAAEFLENKMRGSKKSPKAV